MSTPHSLGLSIYDIIRLAYESGYDVGNGGREPTPEELKVREEKLHNLLRILGLDDIHLN